MKILLNKSNVIENHFFFFIKIFYFSEKYINFHKNRPQRNKTWIDPLNVHFATMVMQYIKFFTSPIFYLFIYLFILIFSRPADYTNFNVSNFIHTTFCLCITFFFEKIILFVCICVCVCLKI